MGTTAAPTANAARIATVYSYPPGARIAMYTSFLSSRVFRTAGERVSHIRLRTARTSVKTCRCVAPKPVLSSRTHNRGGTAWAKRTRRLKKG